MKTKPLICHLAQLPFALAILAVAALLLQTGCAGTSAQFSQNPILPPKETKDVVLSEADVLGIAIPGADNLNTTQTIRRDGKITLPLVGDVQAAGKTPNELEKDLVKLYSTQLVSSRDITVVVLSSTFPVFVTGAIERPGKILSNHPITVLEAIMESGGPDYSKANLKKVRIIRNTDKGTKNFKVNLNGLENSAPIDVFYLQPNDIVYVPAKIVWF